MNLDHDNGGQRRDDVRSYHRPDGKRADNRREGSSEGRFSHHSRDFSGGNREERPHRGENDPRRGNRCERPYRAARVPSVS